MSCRPKCLKTLLRKICAISVALMVLKQGVRITPFIRPWSTMTMIESWLSKDGRSVMRSMESYLKRRIVEEAMGMSGGMVG